MQQFWHAYAVCPYIYSLSLSSIQQPPLPHQTLCALHLQDLLQGRYALRPRLDVGHQVVEIVCRLLSLDRTRHLLDPPDVEGAARRRALPPGARRSALAGLRRPLLHGALAVETHGDTEPHPPLPFRAAAEAGAPQERQGERARGAGGAAAPEVLARGPGDSDSYARADGRECPAHAPAVHGHVERGGQLSATVQGYVEAGDADRCQTVCRHEVDRHEGRLAIFDPIGTQRQMILGTDLCGDALRPLEIPVRLFEGRRDLPNGHDQAAALEDAQEEDKKKRCVPLRNLAPRQQAAVHVTEAPNHPIH
mmetsp:Transcript_71313/g.191324  ORF Transcript_71313/g.191324 Transcript_71313/m.191324 type:complete len:307 (+) Transcript_71313:366-1286(+)